MITPFYRAAALIGALLLAGCSHTMQNSDATRPQA